MSYVIDLKQKFDLIAKSEFDIFTLSLSSLSILILVCFEVMCVCCIISVCVGAGTACEIDTKLAYSDHASINVPLFAIQF